MARPETLRVLAGGEQSDNTITATIGDAVLMGATTRLSAVSADGTVLNVAMLTSPDGLSYNRGDNVRLGWPLSATVALVDDGSVP